MRRSIATVLLIAHVAGCVAWKKDVAVEPATFEGQERARVTLVDSTVVDLYDPRLDADSLRGNAYVRRGTLPVPRVIPIDSVRSVAIGKESSTGVVVVVLLGLAVVGGIVLLAKGVEDYHQLAN